MACLLLVVDDDNYIKEPWNWKLKMENYFQFPRKYIVDMMQSSIERQEKTMHVWKVSVINRRLNFHRYVEVIAADYQHARELAKHVIPGYDEVEWCRESLPVSK